VIEDVHQSESESDKSTIVGFWNKCLIIANSSTLSYVELNDTLENL